MHKPSKPRDQTLFFSLPTKALWMQFLIGDRGTVGRRKHQKKLSNSIFIPSPHIGFEHVDENCGLKSLLPRSWRLLTTTTTTAFFSSFAHCSFQSRLKPFKKSGPKQARESSVFRRYPLYRYAPAPEEMRKCLGFPLRHSLTPASV